MGAATVGHAVLVVGDLQPVDPERRDGVGVGGREGGLETSGVGGGGIRSDAAEGGLGLVASHQLVEAREGGRRVLDLEALPARQQTVGAEDQQLADGALEGAAPDALGAEAGMAHEERVRLQREDVVDAPAESVYEIEEGADRLYHPRRPVQRSEADGAMVDDLDVWGKDSRQVLEVERHHVGGDRACRRRGAGTCRALGKYLSVALIQPRDAVAQAIVRELLEASPSRVAIDLQQIDAFVLVGTDVELLAGGPARRYRPAKQREGIAERC